MRAHWEISRVIDGTLDPDFRWAYRRRRPANRAMRSLQAASDAWARHLEPNLGPGDPPAVVYRLHRIIQDH